MTAQVPEILLLDGEKHGMCTEPSKVDWYQGQFPRPQYLLLAGLYRNMGGDKWPPVPDGDRGQSEIG